MVSVSRDKMLTLEMPFLLGGTVMTIFGGGNKVWIDAFVVH